MADNEFYMQEKILNKCATNENEYFIKIMLRNKVLVKSGKNSSNRCY